jgi:hypothetical protein
VTTNAKAFTCPNCGAPAKPGASCKHCGVVGVLSQEGGSDRLSIGGVRCLSCGDVNPLNQPHCNRCGARLNGRCFQCGADVYVGASHCGACGQVVDDAGKGDALEQVKRLMGAGDYQGAHDLLVPMVDAGIGGVEVILALATCKYWRHVNLSSDVRFANVSQAARFEALQLVERIVQMAPGSPQATGAAELRGKLLEQVPGSPAGVSAGAVLGIGLIIFVLLFCLCKAVF